MQCHDSQTIMMALKNLQDEVSVLKETLLEQSNKIEQLEGIAGRPVHSKSRNSKAVTDIQTLQLHSEIRTLRDSQNMVFELLNDWRVPNSSKQIVQMQNEMQELRLLQTEIINIMNTKPKKLTDSTATKMQDQLSKVHHSQLYLHNTLSTLKNHVTNLESRIKKTQKSISHSELAEMHAKLVDMLRFRDSMIGNIGAIEENIQTISTQNIETNKINTLNLQNMHNDIVKQSFAIHGHFHDLYSDVVQCVGIVDEKTVQMIKMAAQQKATYFDVGN
jgi:hypothetical protein